MKSPAVCRYCLCRDTVGCFREFGGPSSVTRLSTCLQGPGWSYQVPRCPVRSEMPSDKRLLSMRSFHRQSTTEDFVMSPESPLPDVPSGGARVKVDFSVPTDPGNPRNAMEFWTNIFRARKVMENDDNVMAFFLQRMKSCWTDGSEIFVNMCRYNSGFILTISSWNCYY